MRMKRNNKEKEQKGKKEEVEQTTGREDVKNGQEKEEEGAVAKTWHSLPGWGSDSE